jgi:threonine synthase
VNRPIEIGPVREIDMYATHLVCKGCGSEHPLDARFACDRCFGPLEAAYDHPAIARGVSRDVIQSGPPTLWRWAAFLPVDAPAAGLPVGNSPLIRADRLAAELGLSCRLYVKTETSNPTHSFKDRVVAVAAAKSVELGFEALACASTGNLAGATAAVGAALGLPTYIFVPGNLEREKIIAAAAYGATVFAVDGSYDDVNRLASEIAGEQEGWAFVNVNVRPFYAEGSKTLGFEIAEQLGWRLPDQIVIPVASGSQLTKVHKAFQELIALGLVEDKPYRVYGAQAAGCSPVSAAFKSDAHAIRPVRPDTIAKSLAIGNPADGVYVLDICRQTGGAVEDVTDDQIRAGIVLLARTEGIFTETAGGTTVAVLKKLVETGTLDPDLETVVINTGHGLKTLDAVGDAVGPRTTIDPSYAAFVATGIA